MSGQPRKVVSNVARFSGPRAHKKCFGENHGIVHAGDVGTRIEEDPLFVFWVWAFALHAHMKPSRLAMREQNVDAGLRTVGSSDRIFRGDEIPATSQVSRKFPAQFLSNQLLE